MRSAMGKDFVREISHTRSRFLSILVLVALSVAFCPACDPRHRT